MLIFSEQLRAIGVPHGFTTRVGGVSRGMFSALNFGNPGELAIEDRDPPQNISENLAMCLAEIDRQARPSVASISPMCDREIVQVHQVHGAKVCLVGAGRAAHEGDASTTGGVARDTKADAIVSDDPTRALMIRVADCVPVLLSSRDGRVVSAVHAGWRGVVSGVVVEAMRAMSERFGARTDSMVVAIGPCIGPDAFEVGPEVVEEFDRVFGCDAGLTKAGSGSRAGKWMIDLQLALRQQIIAWGVDARNIEVIRRCTFSEPEVFFSHRRDRGRTGRMGAIIGARSAQA